MPLEIRGRNGRLQFIDTILATGFNGTLSLPPNLIVMLGIEVEYQTNVLLGDNVPARLNTFTGHILWHERLRAVPILESRGAPLVGMRLLAGSQLTVQIRNGGDVQIDEMEQSNP